MLGKKSHTANILQKTKSKNLSLGDSAIGMVNNEPWPVMIKKIYKNREFYLVKFYAKMQKALLSANNVIPFSRNNEGFKNNNSDLLKHAIYLAERQQINQMKKKQEKLIKQKQWQSRLKTRRQQIKKQNRNNDKKIKDALQFNLGEGFQEIAEQISLSRPLLREIEIKILALMLYRRLNRTKYNYTSSFQQNRNKDLINKKYFYPQVNVQEKENSYENWPFLNTQPQYFQTNDMNEQFLPPRVVFQEIDDRIFLQEDKTEASYSNNKSYIEPNEQDLFRQIQNFINASKLRLHRYQHSNYRIKVLKPLTKEQKILLKYILNNHLLLEDIKKQLRQSNNNLTITQSTLIIVIEFLLQELAFLINQKTILQPNIYKSSLSLLNVVFQNNLLSKQSLNKSNILKLIKYFTLSFESMKINQNIQYTLHHYQYLKVKYEQFIFKQAKKYIQEQIIIENNVLMQSFQ